VQPTPFAGGRRVRPWRLRTAGTSVLAVVAVLAASLPGDVVSIRFGDTPAGDTTVGDAFVNADAVQSGTTVTVTGHIGPGVNRDNTEQRIVEPALTDTAVGRRDVRALPGPLTRPPGAATPRAWSSRATPSPPPTCSTTRTWPGSRPRSPAASG
jgi:hypothetical protein